MKVEVKKEEVKFQPVNLNITFETAEEFAVFDHMIAQSIRIPELVYPNPDSLRLKLKILMDDISREMGYL